MSFVAAFWLLLFQALSSPTALDVQPRQRASVRAHAELATERPAEVTATTPRAPVETVRASHVAAPTALARIGWRLPLGNVQVLPTRDDSAPRLGSTTQRVLRSVGSETHRLSSRGSLLPYDPTAPPVRG